MILLSHIRYGLDSSLLAAGRALSSHFASDSPRCESGLATRPSEVTISIQGSPVETPEFVPDWEPGEGDSDVLWSPIVSGGAVFNDGKNTLGVFLSKEDALSGAVAQGYLVEGFTTGTLEMFTKKALAQRRTAVVLRDGLGNEIDRWPV